MIIYNLLKGGNMKLKKMFYIMILLVLLFIIYSFFYSPFKKQIYIGHNNLIIDNRKPTKVKELQEEYNNKDIVGYISIPNTNINEPILQSTDNEFYLNHGIDKKKNIIGSTFLDYRVKINNEKKNLIYSHNSSTFDVPFKELEKYYNEDFYKNNKYIYLEDEENKVKYQIFSVYVETSNWDYMKLNFTDEGWLEHLNKLKSLSWYETGVNVSKDDEILILQTCSHHKKYNNYKNKYLLIIAKKI